MFTYSNVNISVWLLTHESDILAASAVSQLVIFGCLLSAINSLMHALATSLSSSHSYKSYFCLVDNAVVSANLSFSCPSLYKISRGLVSNYSFTLPVCKAG